MIRTLLATTAVAAILALPVIAQDASSSMDSTMSSMETSSMMDSSMSSMDSSMMSSEAPMDSSMMSSEAPMDSSMMSSEAPMDSSMMSSVEVVTDTSMQPTAPFDIVTGYTQIDSDRFATRIIGQPVYDGPAADANHLGDINDLIVDERGTVIAATIGVGGFLGIGEKQVAVAFSALQWVVATDTTERFVLETTVEELTSAPDFVVVDDNPADGSSAEAVTSSAM